MYYCCGLGMKDNVERLLVVFNLRNNFWFYIVCWKINVNVDVLN